MRAAGETFQLFRDILPYPAPLSGSPIRRKRLLQSARVVGPGVSSTSIRGTWSGVGRPFGFGLGLGLGVPFSSTSGSFIRAVIAAAISLATGFDTGFDTGFEPMAQQWRPLQRQLQLLGRLG